MDRAVAVKLELLRRASPRFYGRLAACIGVLALMSLCLIAFDTSTSRKIQSAQGSLKHTADAPQQLGRRFLLLAYMRSGSTFTSEVLTLNPDFNFMFEPLWLFRKASGFSWRRGSDTESAARLITQMLQCDPILTGFAMNSTFVNRTRFNMNSCVENPLLMKTIRIHGAVVGDLLKMNPELKIIHLMRDPRGILSSRADRKQPTSATAVCNQMEADINVMDQLSADDNANRYMSVKYEDLVSPTLSQSIIQDLYGFMDVTLDLQLLQGYLRSHYGDESKLAKTGYNTFRDEHFDPNTWRTKMSLATQKQVEEQCASVMKRFGYTSSQPSTNKCVDSNCR